MKPKLLLIFSLIVVIPTVTIICLGISLTKSERSSIEAQFNEVIKQRLQDINATISKVIKDKEVALLPLTEIHTTDVSELREISRTNPMISQVFILSDKRKLIFPSPNARDLSNNEIAFLERTNEIWESGETFDTTLNETIDNNSVMNSAPGNIQPNAEDNTLNQQGQNQQKRQSKKQEVQEVQIDQLPVNNDDGPQVDDNIDYVVSDVQVEQKKINWSIQYGGRSGNAKRSQIYNLQSSLTVQPGSGWYTWFRGRGLHLILWVRNEANMLIGIELNRSRLISDVINALPNSMESTNQTIVLKSASKDLYQWGDYKISKDEEPRVELSLAAPFQSWKLANYSNATAFTNSLSKTIIFNYAVSGIILGVLLIFLCVYFYRENSRQLRESSTKVNFVNQVSHELKTPLTNIRMYAELLENRLDSSDPKSTKQLNVIVSESQRLSRLINNVLSFAKQEKNKLKINKREMAIGSIIDSVIAHFKPLFNRKKIGIEIVNSATKNISADTDAVEQIIGNLLSNIEKYVPNGGAVNITTEQTASWTTVTVTDNGAGVPENQKKKIFDAFHRISNQLSDGISGTGIGLSISRELALMHGGDLKLLASDSGASFQLKLPT